jgi:pimeloyl-ACP methyl ester carboxylesterase
MKTLPCITSALGLVRALTLTLLATAVVTSGHALGAPEIADTTRIALGPCRVDGLDATVRCATLEVPEDPAAPEGRRITLRLVVLPALGSEPAPDPIFVLTGGPGQAATESAAAFAEDLAASRARRDLVLVDQRGTGGSNPLRCQPPEEPEADGFTVQSVRQCRAELERVADLRRYTTLHAAADLEAVREALGHERINLDGGSYGTRLALVYMREYPERVRSAVLRGLSPTDFRNPLPFPRAGQEALEKLFDACAAESRCASAFPELARDFAAVLAQLESGAIRIDLAISGSEDGDASVPEVMVLSRDLFTARVHLLLFSTELASQLPFLIHRAARGDYEPFARLAVAFATAIREQIYFGMQLSVVCPEDLARITDDDVARETPGTYLGRARIDLFRTLCAEWPVAELPSGYWDPVEAATPVLLISGMLDPATPPRFAYAATRGLPNSHHLVLEEATHIVRSACIERIVADFIAAATAEGLDTACAREIRRPPFFVPDGAADR